MRSEVPALDHVLVAVSDLAAATEWWRASYGLGAVPGGEFPDQGLTTAIIPVGGTQYIELVAGLDRSPDSPLYQRVLDHRGVCFDWAVVTSEIESDAQRVGRPITPGSISLAGGGKSSWRCVDPDPGTGLPFFIEYDDPQVRLARWQERFERAKHDQQPVGLGELTTPATAESLNAWLGVTIDGVTSDAPSLGFTVQMADGLVCNRSFESG